MGFRTDGGQLGESGLIGSMLGNHEPVKWRCHYRVEKLWKAADGEHNVGDMEIVEGVGNAVMNGGASLIFERMITKKPSTSSTGAALQAFSSGNSRIGVGNSSAAAVVTQTDLQGASKKYNGMQSGYPTHTDGTSSSGSRQISLRAVFTTAQANFNWLEWGAFNSTTATKRMLNRKAGNLGTKTSSAQWTFTVTLGIS